MLQSRGVLKAVTLWEGTTRTFPGFSALPLGTSWVAYDAIYQQQAWVYTVVNKLANGEARLPLKVYERTDAGRPEVPDHPYAQLLRNPHPRLPRFYFWQWVISTYNVYGEAFLLKQRDAGGRPVALLPLHPGNMHEEDREGDETIWRFQNGQVQIDRIRDSDLVHPKSYNPTTITRGLSPLEPLRRTLEFEDAAQRAQSSFWRKGARPGTALTHPGTLTTEAADRLKLRWDAVAAGADNTGTTIVLEEGMKPERLSVSNEEAQYIDSRKLNREEVCAVYDVPPPAVHILDRATFSNVTEQFRSLYRDTHAPRLQMFESVLETELRGSVRKGADGPDFSDDVYAEFLLDEVLRGDFETRMAAYQTGINSGSLVVNEVRRLENRPAVDGGDVPFVNSALIPLDQDNMSLRAKIDAAGVLIRAGFDPDDSRDAVGLPPIKHTGAPPVTVQSDEFNPVPAATQVAARSLEEGDVRTVMGRLSRPKTLADVDVAVLTAGLKAPELVGAVVGRVRAADGDMAALKAALKELAR